MSGGILQLVSYGSADIYLTGDPQVTFWRQVSRRYTNFAVESVLQTFHGTADFGRRVSVTLAHTGDLIHRMYLEVTLPPIDRSDLPVAYQDKAYYWVPKVGMALIKSTELEIGGIRIDKHPSEWMDAWSSLSYKNEKDFGFRRMIGDVPLEERRADTPMTLYIPLMFFFNNQHGLALPLVSISFHEVRLNFEFRTLNELLVPPPNPYANPSQAQIQQYMNEVFVDETSATAMNCDLYADTVYLDVSERRRFSKNPQEMLISVVQFLGDDVISPAEASADGLLTRKLALNFVHPVKELVWMFVPEDKLAEKQYFEYADVVEEVSILLNGHPRFAPRKGSYFRHVQPWQHHTSTPTKPVYVYSFGLHPEEAQPSGTLNFSRIDQAHMIMRIRLPKNAAGQYVGGRLKIFASSYNVLRIKSGLAGLAYSN